MSGKSCLTKFISFFEGVTKKVDEGSAVDIVCMDFSKAFDKVPHGRLLHKVKSHGIQGEVSKWMESAHSPRVCVGSSGCSGFLPQSKGHVGFGALAMLNSPSVYPNRRRSVATRGFSQ